MIIKYTNLSHMSSRCHQNSTRTRFLCAYINKGGGGSQKKCLLSQLLYLCAYYMNCDMRFQQCGMCDKQSLTSAYAESVQSLCKSLEYSISVKLLTEHHLEFLSLKVGCTGSSESTLVLSKCHIVGNYMSWQSELLWPIPWNSAESNLGCTSRIYFDNVTLTSQKPGQHNNNCDRI